MSHISSWLKPRQVAERLKRAVLKGAARVHTINNDERGQSLVEYALIIALISLVIVAASEPVRTALQNMFTRIVNALNTEA